MNSGARVLVSAMGADSLIRAVMISFRLDRAALCRFGAKNGFTLFGELLPKRKN